MAAKTVSVEAAIEELIMRENGDGDADYELSLSDSEEEASANDESSDDQTGSENHAVATRNATPKAAKQAAAPSILTVLRPPRPSELSRKRTIDRNPPPKGKKRSKCSNPNSDPKSITPEHRVKDARYANNV